MAIEFLGLHDEDIDKIMSGVLESVEKITE